MPDSPVQDVASHASALDAIDCRQDEILTKLDELNEHILKVLAEHGVPAPRIPPPFRADKAAA